MTAGRTFYDPAADAVADARALRQVRAALAEARARLVPLATGGFLVVAQGGAVVRKFDGLGEIRRAICDARRLAQGDSEILVESRK